MLQSALSVKSNTVSIRNNHRPILCFEHPLQAAQVHCSRLPKPTATASKGVAFTAMFRLSMLVSTTNLSALQTCGQLPFPDADSHASSFVKKDDAHEPNPHLLSSQRSLPLIASACLKLQGSGGVVRKHALLSCSTSRHWTIANISCFKLYCSSAISPLREAHASQAQAAALMVKALGFTLQLPQLRLSIAATNSSHSDFATSGCTQQASVWLISISNANAISQRNPCRPEGESLHHMPTLPVCPGPSHKQRWLC